MNELPTTDWDEIRRRIDEARQSMERAWGVTPEFEAEILKRRARALAAPAPHAPQVDLLQVVEFDLGSERYAIELRFVSEVFVLKELTPVPCCPPHIAGIVNLRGEIRTILSLKALLNLPRSSADLGHVIMTDELNLRIGLQTDTIRGVRSISVAELHGSLPALSDIRADRLRGITLDGTAILDLQKLLATNMITVEEEVTV